MMNSHIAIFLAGTEKAGFSIKLDGAGVGIGIVISPRVVVLIIFPRSRLLKLHPQQNQQVNPQSIHKMPIVGGRVQSALSQRGIAQLSDHAHQAPESAEHVESMYGRKDVKERTVWIGCQIETLSSQLRPRYVLAYNEQKTQGKRRIQPARWVTGIRF